MAKVPPQFVKKTGNGNKPPLSKKGPSPQNRTPVDAPNAGQDEALSVVRNSLTAPKSKAMKGKPPC